MNDHYEKCLRRHLVFQAQQEGLNCDILKRMHLTMKDVVHNCAGDLNQLANETSGLRSFVDNYIAQFALLGIQVSWTTDMTLSLETMRVKKSAMKDVNRRQLDILGEMSSWCLQDLGISVNRRKIETLRHHSRSRS